MTVLTHLTQRLQEPLLLDPQKAAMLWQVLHTADHTAATTVLPYTLGVPEPKGELPVALGLSPSQSDLWHSSRLNISFPDANPNGVIIPVFGSLVARGGFSASGSTSYASIKADITTAVSQGFTDILLHFGTPGGEARLVWELADYIFNLNKSGMARIGSYTDTAACSAGQLLQAATSMRMAHSTATLGSIGVIMMVENSAKADALAGYSYEVYKTGQWKDLGNPHRATLADESEKLQAMVDSLGMQFFARMETYTGFSAEHFAALQAGTFQGQAAVDLGLATALGTYEDALAWLDGLSNVKLSKSNSRLGGHMTDETSQTIQAAEGETVTSREPSTSTPPPNSVEDAVLARVAAIQQVGTTYGCTQEFINQLIQDKVSVQLATAMCRQVAAASTASQPIFAESPAAVTKPEEKPTTESLATRLGRINLKASA